MILEILAVLVIVIIYIKIKGGLYPIDHFYLEMKGQIILLCIVDPHTAIKS